MVVSSRRRVRCAGVVGARAVSLAAGLGLVLKLVTPQSIAVLGTPELLGMLALLVLPVCVVAALRMHRRCEATDSPADLHIVDARAMPASGDARRIVVLAPDVRDRSAERHRRRRAVQHGVSGRK